ncbi:MAG: zinc ABC transporter substrate-binding protein [Candidatus Electrothrix aestuarii]|uniref:Zinc ABC transporter substrate-binding protein n=1 Tax=Candidatus Electrothrix aestuarii TaxID=3062594 RepID=A0AAU8M034_9BACT|nr:zinc ABC transporter substrate-binding protein [Candidatus Electrothrix aestuarii]
MKNVLRAQFLLVVCLVFSTMQASAQDKKCHLNIGASLHPYYSWVKNIVGDEANVTSIIPPGSDPHAYQPVPSDMEHLENLDAIVINGIGHDEFIKPMLKAIENDKLLVINTSKGLPLIPVFNKHAYGGEAGKVSYNSHTYIAITGAIQQIQMIARKLSRLCPDQASLFIRNTRAYSMKLRNMLQAALMRIDMLDLNNLRIATVHDGYSYLFQELGIEVSAVVQPRHGVKPSARQLQDTIKRIKRAKVNVLFGELDYEKKYVDIIFKETGCRLYALSHISNGAYSKEHFERTMQGNINTIIAALTEVSGGMRPGGAASGSMSGQIQDNMSRQMQDASQQMQNSVQERIQNAVPAIQQQQMSERMNQQLQDTTKQMQEGVQKQLQDAIPAIQQKQMSERMGQQVQDTTKQMQDSMQESLKESLPEMQQEQVKNRMGQQMQDMQKGMMEKMAPKIPQDKE